MPTNEWLGTTEHGAPIGSVIQWPSLVTAPDGWLVANGGTASRTTYADLFALLGTAYGVGDGSTTFTLPTFGADYYIRS